MMLGYLKGQGLTVTRERERVRSALKNTDPIGTAKRWGCTVDRRIYSVSCPKSLWHIDAYHKLIRFVKHTF
ncbi:hypothetical protein HOLleu_42446 [Holothuria leucospilota]|uniref:Uncharacterized protein n=1 Tax=Holothuria leucospilota TaxID=206669 RepID=A0A9Q0YI73_HOLLE|nr:hypothetical protein HOLleu_42446 [Holothuria leucospilota]